MLKINRATYSIAKLLDMSHDGKLITIENDESSSIVEAMLMGIPITIVCKQQLNGVLEVVYGNIKSVIDFLDNKTPLKACQFYSQFEGKFSDELDNLYINILLNTNIQLESQKFSN